MCESTYFKIHIYAYLYVYEETLASPNICMHLYVYLYISVSTYKLFHSCTCKACIYMQIYVYVCLHICIFTFMSIYVCSYICIRIGTCLTKFIIGRILECILFICTPKYMYMHVDMYYVYIFTFTWRNTCFAKYQHVFVSI